MDLLGEDARPVRLRRAPLEELARPVEVGERLRCGDVVLRHPERRDEPRVAGHVRDVLRLLEVVIVLVAREAADRGLHPEPRLERGHRGHDPRIVGREHPEEEDAGDRHVERRILRDRAVRQDGDRPHESPALLVVEVREGRRLDLLGRGPVALRKVVLPERGGEVARGRETGPHGGRRERVDPAPLLPEVERRRRKLRPRLAVARHEVRAGPHELPVERTHELDVAVAVVVLPERPDRQAGLVLLDRELEPAVRRRPGVPRRAERAVGVVLVEQVPVPGHELAAEIEEPAGHLAVAGQVERVRDERAVARPEVRIGVAVEPEHVGVVAGDDRAAVVDLGADDERRLLVQVDERLGQMVRDGHVLVRPEVPVVAGPRQERAHATLADELVEIADLVVGLAGGDDERRGGERVRTDPEAEHPDAVDRALGHEVP